MNIIEIIEEWVFENWQIIIIILIFLIVGVSVYNYSQQDPWECKEFDLVDKFEENSKGYLIYYSDGRIKDVYNLPRCIKLKQ